MINGSDAHLVRSSPQGLGPRLLEPLVSELRFSNTTGASLNCAVVGQPPPRVTWLREGVEVEPLQGLLLFLPNGTLRFPPFAASQFRQEVHGATYRCRAENIFGAILSTEVRVRAVVDQYYEVQVYDEFTIAGNTAVLRCHVPSFVRDDVMVVSWEKKTADKTDVVVNGGRMSAFPSGELQVRQVQQTDGTTEFRCRTWHRLNGETKHSSYGRLVVTDLKVNVPPRITNVRSSVVANEGDSVELPCAAQGYPPPTYLWERLTTADNASPLNPVVSGSSRYEPTEGSLLIRKVDPQDAGKYLCLATNAVGEERATITLDVRSPVDARLVPEVLTAHVGQPASLRCVSAGRPPPLIRWFKDAQELLDDGVRVRLLDERHLMQLATVSTQDGGIYQCLAYNALAQAQASAQLILGDTAPVLLESPKDFKVKPGDSLLLKCEATGSPAPKITWSVDGIPARHMKSSRVNISEASHGDNHLASYVNISRVRTNEAGVWRCVAVNSAGVAEATARVAVRGPPAVRPFESNRTAVATETLEMHCALLTYPIRSVHWEKDGRKVPFHHRQKVFANGTLLVLATTVQDAGKYTCVATNDEGQKASASLHVAVKVPPLIERFAFDENLHEGMRTRVYCNIARGDPPVRITWLRDGQPIKSGPDIEVRVLDPFSVALAIDSLSPSHDGSYTCVASNNAATVNYTAPLRVHVPPHWIKEPAETSAVEGHSASMDCVADGHPTPRVTWHRGVEPQVSGGVPARPVSVPSSQFWHETRGLRTGQRYEFWVTASTGAGEGPATRIVTQSPAVRAPARIASFSREVSVALKQDLELPCRTAGQPTPGREWRTSSGPLRESDRVRVLPSGTLHIEAAETGDATNYTCYAHNLYGRDAVHYTVRVHVNISQKSPRRPASVSVLSTTSNSITLGWLNRNTAKGAHVPKVKENGSRPRQNADPSLTAREKEPYRQVSGGVPARPVSVPSSQFWHETRGLRTGQRYEFWVTASTGAGEGPATRIVTQSPAVRAPARIASFSREVSVALKQDLELPCRTAGQPTPGREWRTRSFERDTWSQRLLTVLPCEAAEVIARLSKEDADDYEKVKACLLRKCNETGHIAVNCKKERVAFSYVSDCEENMRLLEPYMHDLVVNGRPCKVLRDSAATMDVVHPSYVSSSDYTGQCSWIRQVVEEQSVCLPIATVVIEGPFEPTNVVWDEKKEAAFLSLKAVLIGRPVLRAPDYDREFTVQCDASDRGLGAVLCQKDDEVNISQKSPRRPASVSVLSTTSNSITLGWLNRNTAKGAHVPKVKEYEVHYKRQQGSWDLVHVTPPQPKSSGNAGARGTPSPSRLASATRVNGSWLAHELTGLSCGTQYHIYVVAVADRGRSEPSDTVFARTKGGVPTSPKREAFVTPNASSLTLRPSSWASGPSGCPVSHLAVEYRPRDGTGPWTVASRALQPREGPMTLHHLRPDTWYNLRVTAHTEAGTTSAEYAIRTLPASATRSGTVLPELMVVNGGGGADGELPLLVPIATSLSLALAAASIVLAYVCCRRRAEPTFAKDHG
ncbi:Down syndrome cell adhesion molecule-like protein Dscam2 [Rhipicephalus sanguineus]|uniref:Down syndrome cell adhesion molecule-like protein Dscam2 n=1 Tax=Rhipicephalus sanguineus TaxID=34632 RepID=UPI00189571A7|nr:Down syndrome cell adhesion molecule-like protein Dscam2 [Rhipicephalus sanguineus]